jgi:hypothetical protein
LQGAVVDSQIQSVSWNKITAVSIDAGTITTGYLSGNRIYGGEITGANIGSAGFVVAGRIVCNGTMGIGDTTDAARINCSSLYIGGAYAATQSWVNSQGFYNSGDSPSFGTVNASSRYNCQGVSGISYYSGTISRLTIRGGIITGYVG